MPIAAKLIEVAAGEWERWGFSTVPLHGRKTIGGTEKKPPYVAYVNDYWKAVGQSTWNGNTKKPWSAAFISFCFQKSNAGKGFPYSSGHVGYCKAFVRNPGKYPGLVFSDPATTQLALGDLVFAGRSGDGCATPPATHALALAAIGSADGFFCSHADIVVALRPGEIDVIGGNVSDSVTLTTYSTTGGRIADPRHQWLGVLKNTL